VTAAGGVTPAEALSLRVATWNIHACVGIDRRYDPARTAAVLREIDADIVCLQEADTRRGAAPYSTQWAYLGAATGHRVVLGGGAHDRPRRLCNVILSRFPALAARTIDLTVSGRAPRVAVDAELLIGGRVLRIVSTHLGLHPGERVLQANRLTAALGESAGAGRAAHAVLLMGDLNEWRGRSGVIRTLDRRLGPSAAPRTFPSWMPMLPLDRIYVAGAGVLAELSVHRSPLARVASDHLPLVAILSWGAPLPGRRERQRFSRRRPSLRRSAGEPVAPGAPPR
jgi:endonuclease/exonuclease/phosphatase family metal-dependent hydrolase